MTINSQCHILRYQNLENCFGRRDIGQDASRAHQTVTNCSKELVRSWHPLRLASRGVPGQARRGEILFAIRQCRTRGVRVTTWTPAERTVLLKIASHS